MKTYLIHGLWILVALGAFALGRMQNATQGDDSQSGQSAESKSSGRIAGGATGSSPAAGDSTSAGASRRNARADDIGSVRILSPEAMEAALAKILTENDPLKRQKEFAALLESLTPENAEAAVRALQDAPRSRWSWGQEYSLLTYAWGRIDGKAAVGFAKGLEGRTREWTMASVLAGWANDSPGEAQAWVDSIEDPGERRDFTRGLVYGLAQRDVDAATSYVLGLPDDDKGRNREYIGSIARQQLGQGIDAVTAWSESLPDGDMKGTALRTIADDYVRRNPAEAAAWAEKYAETDYGVSAISEIADEWAEKDPKAALDWAATLPEGSSRNHALGESISEWAQKDPTAAGNYVATMPDGIDRDFAVSSYARRVVREDPGAAMQWAQAIDEPKIRDKTVVRTAREWMQRDATAAGAWVDSAQLPETVVQEILAPQKTGDRGGYHYDRR